MPELIPVEGYRWLFIRKPYDVFVLRQPANNHKIQSLRTKDESEAKRLYEELLGRPVAPKRDVYVRDAWTTFKEEQRRRQSETIDRYDKAWRNWCADLLDHMRVSDVEPIHIQRGLVTLEMDRHVRDYLVNGLQIKGRRA